MAATDMPTARRFRLRGAGRNLIQSREKEFRRLFLILGAALDNRTAMGKDYPAKLWQEYHSVLPLAHL
jgi:hypothetical protein